MWPFTFVNISYLWPFLWEECLGCAASKQNPCWKHWAELAAQSKQMGHCPTLPFVLNLCSQIIFLRLALAMELSELSSFHFSPFPVSALWVIIVGMIYFLFTVNQEVLETMLEKRKAKGFRFWGFLFSVVLYFCLGLRLFLGGNRAALCWILPVTCVLMLCERRI